MSCNPNTLFTVLTKFLSTMYFKKIIAIAALCLPVLTVSAQSKAPDSWFNLEPSKDNINGTGGDEALRRLKEKAKKDKL